MQSKYLSMCLGLLLLTPAAAMADDLESQKHGQALIVVPVSPPDAPRVDLEALKLGQGLAATPASPSDAPQTNLEQLKIGSTPQASPASLGDAPSVNLEELKRFGQRSLVEAAAGSREKQSLGASQAAIDAIPLKHGGSGPRILPFPGADGRPIPIGG